MIEEIVKLRRKGLSFRKIAVELNSTVGKVQDQWTKYTKKNTAPLQQDANTEKSNQEQLTSVNVYHHVRREDHLIIWLVSPDRLYSFWRLSDETKNLISHYYQRPFADFQQVLRLYDVTSTLFNGGNALDVYEIFLPENKKSWFIKGLKPNRCYCTELGINLKDRKFLPLLRSNAVYAPRISVEQTGELAREVEWFQNNKDRIPKWVEHVSTYSYYEMKEGMED